MKRCVLLMAAFAFLATSPARAAEETWKGTISDSMCAAKHSADKHGDKAADHATCVQKCVDKGGQYVFLSGDKVYKLTNQSFAGLKTHAGQEVMLTGELKGEANHRLEGGTAGEEVTSVPGSPALGDPGAHLDSLHRVLVRLEITPRLGQLRHGRLQLFLTKRLVRNR